MTPRIPERRYTDREFSVILGVASDLEEDPSTPSAPSARDGLTLEQIQEIAREVGIPAERVARAAALLPPSGEGGVSGLLGGPVRQRLEHVVSGSLSRDEAGHLVDIARRFLSTQGEARDALGGVEWKGGTGAGSLSVSITPREGRTAIQASTDRTEAMAGIYGGIGLSTGVLLTALFGSLVFGESGEGMLAALVSGMTPALVLARSLWKRSTEKWRGRLLHLMDILTREAEAMKEDESS